MAMAISPRPKEVAFQLDNLVLAGQQWGDPTNPLILALHGWLDNSDSFALLAPLLSARGYQVIALDWAGHGLSDHRSVDAPYTLLENLFELNQVIQQLPQPPFCLLGHSMGGILAQLYAGIYPEQIQALVSIEAFGPLTALPGQSAKQLRHAFASRYKAKITEQGYARLEPLFEARARAGGFELKLAERLVRRNLVERSGRWFWRSDARLRQKSAWMMSEDQAQNYLAGFTKRSLVILGQEGFPQLKLAIKERQHWFFDARVEFVFGGHHCHMEAAEQIMPRLEHYFTSIERAC